MSRAIKGENSITIVFTSLVNCLSDGTRYNFSKNTHNLNSSSLETSKLYAHLGAFCLPLPNTVIQVHQHDVTHSSRPTLGHQLPGYMNVPLKQLPLYIDTLPETFDCMMWDRHMCRAYWRVRLDPSNPADNWNQSQQLDSSTSNPCWTEFWVLYFDDIRGGNLIK